MGIKDFSYHGPVVVFDLDDTLFRERDFCRSGFNFLCNPTEYKVVDIPDYPSESTLAGLADKMNSELVKRNNPFAPFEEFFQNFIRSCPGLSKEVSFDIKKHISAYRSHIPHKLDFADGVLPTLNALRERGIRMALITDGRSVTQRRKIQALGLDEFISPDLIFISEESGFDKFSPDMFISVVRHFPEASGFMYVGDNPLKDFFHPNMLGWVSVCVPYHPDNVHPQADPPDKLHAPGITLNNFLELSDHIQVVFKKNY